MRTRPSDSIFRLHILHNLGFGSLAGALTTVIVLFASVAKADSGIGTERPLTVCFFSMNNTEERETLTALAQTIDAKLAQERVKVVDFMAGATRQSKANPQERFLKMIESGIKCDGLVISGHHTGGFSGAMSSEVLELSFLEGLACSEKAKAWFQNIKALWLSGCRTLGVENIGINDTAEHHTQRVGAVLAEDQLPQSMADLNLEFSDTLDQTNPLASRYLRIFPKATVFGWTSTAPDASDGSRYSIPFHIANIVRRNLQGDLHFTSPEEVERMDPRSAEEYSGALDSLLSSSRSDNDVHTAKEAWSDHVNPTLTPYAFKDRDLDPTKLKAYSPLLRGDSSDKNYIYLKKAKEIDCILKSESKSFEEKLTAIKQALSEVRLLGYNFNSIWEMLQNVKSSDKPRLVSTLKASPIFQKFLREKLDSPQLGILRKIDYYAFYRNLFEQRLPKVEESLRAQALESVSKGIPNGRRTMDDNDLDYRRTLLMSLEKHHLIDRSFTKDVISKTSDIRTLAPIASELPAHPDLLLSLSKALAEDEDWQVRDSAAQALGKLGPAAAPHVALPLIVALKDEHSNVRVYAAEALGKLGPAAAPHATRPLIAALKDKDSNVRNSAAKALSTLGPIAKKAALLELEKRLLAEQDENVINTIRETIQKIRSSR